MIAEIHDEYAVVGLPVLCLVEATRAAIDLDCQVLSGQPGLYAGLANGGPVIPF